MAAFVRPAALQARRFASAVIKEPAAKMTAEEVNHLHHAVSGEKLWKNISTFVVFPSLLALAIFVYRRETEHLKHTFEHPPEYKAWPHLGIRKSEFPWRDGDKSLFHNDVTNPRPPK
ncbi:cytochrome c oxidase, subunit VIa [Hyaloraphidium curvatum]|nr:cytochrome c oxidase, subunit VIa [Hyaloraphidium curvatum]